jgi:hypothetical protein
MYGWAACSLPGPDFFRPLRFFFQSKGPGTHLALGGAFQAVVAVRFMVGPRNEKSGGADVRVLY